MTDIQLRRGTSGLWTSTNSILSQGEPGVETDTLKMKIGDGTTPWTQLPYVGLIATSSITEADLASAVQNDLTLATTALQSLAGGTGVTVSGNTISLSSDTQAALAEAATALQSLTAGTDVTVSGSTISLSQAAQSALALANSALQSIVPGADITVSGNTVALSSAAQQALGLANTALQTSLLAGLGTSILKDNGSGGFAAAIPGTDYGTYNKPQNGIPATDLTSDVQANLTLASTALQTTGITTPIPESELAAAVQTDLNLAATALQNLSAGTGVNVSGNQVSLSPATQTALAEAATALQSLTAGTDISVSGGTVSLSSAAQTALGLANSALQSITAGADISVTGNTVALSSAAQTALGLAGTALQTSALAGLGTSILKDSGAGGFAAAVPGTDYAPPTAGSALLKGDGSGGFSTAVSNTDYVPPSGVVITGGTLDGVIIGGTTPVPSINATTVVANHNVALTGTQEPWLNRTGTFTGTLTGGGALNYVALNDQIVGDTHYIHALNVTNNVFSPSIGSRSGVAGQVWVTSAGANTRAQASYVGIYGVSHTGVNLGGVSANPRGSFWGGWFQSGTTGGTYHDSVIGVEIDTYVESAQIGSKIGLRVQTVVGDVTQGTTDDAAVQIIRAGTVSWLNGIMFGSNQADEFGGSNPTGISAEWPFSSSSTIIGTSVPGAGLPANIGIDFSTVTFADSAIKTGPAPIQMGAMASPPSTPASSKGKLYVASDSSLHYVNSTADTNLLNAAPDAFFPADYGLIAWNYDPTFATGSSNTLTAGDTYLELLPIRQATTITNMVLQVAVAGATLTTGQCFAGLFDHNGNLLSATADQSTNWASTGTKVMALTTPQPVTAGLYYVGWFANGTTLPKLYYYASASVGVGIASGSPLSTSPRSVLDTTHTGLTTAFHSPATFTTTAPLYWAAVS